MAEIKSPAARAARLSRSKNESTKNRSSLENSSRAVGEQPRCRISRGLSLPIWPAYLPLFYIDSTCFLRHHAGIPASPHSRENQVHDTQSDESQRQKVPRALLEAFLLFVALASLGVSTLHGQSPQTSCSDKPAAAAATPAATPSPATQQPAKPNGPGLVWVNTDTRVYHKQGSRWYGKTRHGKYMLEADAIKAGYKPAK
jgi:hypothetical protein